MQKLTLAALALSFAITGACGSSGGDDSIDAGRIDASTGTETVSAVIGAEGGTVSLPDGAGVDIPPGALEEPTTITVSVSDSGFTPLPAVSSGSVYAFEPHGLEFLVAVTVIVPHQGQPEELALYTSSPGADWVKLTADRRPTELRAELMHFSFLFNGREVCGLYRQECCRPADGDECAGPALHCVNDLCLECGLEGDTCCGGVGGTCLDTDRTECREWQSGSAQCTACGFAQTPCCGGAGGTCRDGALTCYSYVSTDPPDAFDQCLECGLPGNPCCGGPGGTCDAPAECYDYGPFGSYCEQYVPDAGVPTVDAATEPDAFIDPPTPDAAPAPDAFAPDAAVPDAGVIDAA